MHPALGEIIARVKAKGVKVGFSTNATMLDRLYAVIDDVDIVTVNDDDLRDPAYQWRKNVYVQKLGVNFEYEDYSRRELARDKKAKHIAEAMTDRFKNFKRGRDMDAAISLLLFDGLLKEVETQNPGKGKPKKVLKVVGGKH